MAGKRRESLATVQRSAGEEVSGDRKRKAKGRAENIMGGLGGLRFLEMKENGAVLKFKGLFERKVHMYPVLYIGWPPHPYLYTLTFRIPRSTTLLAFFVRLSSFMSISVYIILPRLSSSSGTSSVIFPGFHSTPSKILAYETFPLLENEIAKSIRNQNCSLLHWRVEKCPQYHTLKQLLFPDDPEEEGNKLVQLLRSGKMRPFYMIDVYFTLY